LTQLMLISIALLFLITLAEAFFILALFRQVGLLHLTLAGSDSDYATVYPAGTVEPFVPGMEVPDLKGWAIQGGPVSLSKLTGQRILLAFVHPLCTPCNEIAHAFQAFHQQSEPHPHIVVVSDGDPLSTEEYVNEHHLSVPVLYEPRNDYNHSAEVLHRFHVPRTPFAYLLDEERRVMTSGTISSTEAFWRVARGLPQAPPISMAQLQPAIMVEA
jgi:peroxiredoxin